MRPAKTKNRPRLFISYSHKDEVWKDRLVAHLNLFEREGLLDVWDDRRILMGSDGSQKIQDAIHSARVAILLISADFLSSAFIRAEVSKILRQQQAGSLRIIPIVVRSCAWQKVPWLADLQVRPRDGRPLANHSLVDVEGELSSLAIDLLESHSDSEGTVHQPSHPWSIASIRMKNVRSFQDFQLDIQGAGNPRSKTLVIGRNGTCKTTLLRALALSLCDPTDASALIAEPIGSFVGPAEESAKIEIQLASRSGSYPFALRMEIWNEGGKDLIRDDSQRPPEAPFVCGYGAGRYGVGTDTGREYRIRDSVVTLFDYRQTLIDSELTLRRLQDYLGSHRFESTLLGIKRVLGLTADDEILLGRGGGVELSGPTIGGRARLESWADGYRLTFAWLLDLYAWAMRADRVAPNGTIEGVLLIDEIEQHLHPSMQSLVLPKLSEAFPRLQIFATTHSPLAALGVSPDELVSLKRVDDRVVAEETIPNFAVYSAEDMIVDERLFDSAAYGAETSEKLERYRKLVKLPSQRRSARQTREILKLASELRAEQLPEVRENEAAEELRKLIARHGL